MEKLYQNLEKDISLLKKENNKVICDLEKTISNNETLINKQVNIIKKLELKLNESDEININILNNKSTICNLLKDKKIEMNKKHKEIIKSINEKFKYILNNKIKE
jgi:hypothetical protein